MAGYCHQEVLDGFASFEKYLNTISFAYVLDTFPQAFDVRNSYVCSSFSSIDVTSESLVFVFGLFLGQKDKAMAITSAIINKTK